MTLVLDADGDGKISRSSEFAFTEWDPSAYSDLEALRRAIQPRRASMRPRQAVLKAGLAPKPMPVAPLANGLAVDAESCRNGACVLGCLYG